MDLTLMDPYQRLATMDLPAMRSLVMELSRISLESSVTAAQQQTPEARARAHRAARRAADAQAVLDAYETHAPVEAGG
jgi:hypothetical protein